MTTGIPKNQIEVIISNISAFINNNFIINLLFFSLKSTFVTSSNVFLIIVTKNINIIPNIVLLLKYSLIPKLNIYFIINTAKNTIANPINQLIKFNTHITFSDAVNQSTLNPTKCSNCPFNAG